MRRIEGANAVEIATGKLGFRGRNTAAGLPGTAVTEQFLNDVQEELAGVVEGAGLALSSDRAQVLKAIKALVGEPYAADTGTENALVVDLATPGFTLAAGKSIKVKVLNSVTYAATIQVSNNGSLVGTYPLVRHDGTALAPYDLVAGQVARLSFDGTSMQIPRVDGRTGDEVTRHATGTLAGYVRKNGRSIGAAGSGATERAASDCRRLYELYWADTNLTVTGGRGATAAADWAAGKVLTLPDARGRVQAGLGDMGNSDSGRLTATYLGADGTVLGAAGGLQSASLVTANLPAIPHTPSGTLSITLNSHGHGVTDPTHTHPYRKPNTPVNAAGVGPGSAIVINSTEGQPTDAAATGITINSATVTVATATFAGATVALGGSSQAFSVVQPTITVGIYIRL
ncbi:hypothetical protein PQJ75_24630 [Rhodoplanes sp. TEM]|uniref:Phage tail collar domain-containing protein n=1 Tax=Rhodoplanes tepidamans TaxID=200616 RepID=A0ABT5JF84_RHOTP|nr:MULTISPECIES: hypothetical protein [Rhodoplanes]MDC7787954.1 hypothetical protein [Rhodoplanes tepidamans]MDC7986928.1 hypothetical protein [Rhodoplanes sp. TEM]MDQ0358383.1 microcystin-dependent protein [Rhodoplanes tepidamans]